MFRFLINFGLILLVFAAQWRIGLALAALVAERQSARAARVVRALLPLAGLALIAGYLLAYTEIRGALPFTSPKVAVFSGICELWLFTSAAGYAIYLALRAAMRCVPFNPARRHVIHTAGGVLLASPFMVVGYGAFVERTRFRVREIDIPIPDLEPGLDGLRLLQLTDIHLSPFLSEQDLARVIHTANEIHPHLTVVTGDLISTRGDPLDACLRLLSTLKSDAGTLACMGNHEHFSGAERYAAGQGAELGIRFLRSQNVTLRFGGALLNVAGVDYQSISSAHKGYLRGAERLIVPGARNVLLSHSPDVFPTAAAQGYDLTISGHTHGGQVNIEIFSRGINPARFFTPFVYGLYRKGGAAVYVSRGIGTIGIPARVGAPPEISVLRLRKA